MHTAAFWRVGAMAHFLFDLDLLAQVISALLGNSFLGTLCWTLFSFCRATRIGLIDGAVPLFLPLDAC
jgi:hypothetical protein